jgi:hypothetical protein
VGRASISIVSPQRAGVKNISMSNKVYYVTIQYICIIFTTDINNSWDFFFTKSAFFGLQLWESGNPCFLVVLLTFRKLHELKRIRDFHWSSFYWKIEPKRQK